MSAAELLTYQQLAEALDVKPGTLKRWRHEGMPAVERGLRVVFSLEEAKAWIARRQSDPNKLRRLRSVTFSRRPTIYFARAANGLVKIGFTSNHERRAEELEVDVIATIAGDKTIEASFHRYFADEHVEGEWFQPSERLLCFMDRLAALHTVRIA